MVGTGGRVARPGTDASAGANDLELRRWRVYLVAAAMIGFSVVLIGRLVYLQVIESSHFRTMAMAEHWRRTVIPPRRGDILDRDGNPLATSVTYQTLYASTSEVRNPSAEAAALAPLLGEPAATLERQLSTKQLAPVLIKKWLPVDVARRVDQLRLDGLFLQFEPKRVYPQGNLAAQLLGVVGVDNNGLSGLEFEFDRDLAGKPGELIAERDTEGDAIALGPTRYRAPVDGSSLTLTIDRYVQWVAERELTAAVERYRAGGGSVVVIDPRTGAILAMAGRPTFRQDDPNLFSPASVALFNLPAIHTAYEADSSFQIITMAAALDSGMVSPQTTWDNTGSFSYFGGTVRDVATRAPGPETMTQVLGDSSAVGTSWLAVRLGAPTFYRYAQAFGVGRATGVTLPGEAGGFLRLPTAPDWYPFDLATNSYGQGIRVTALQMAAAVAAVADGGTMMKPYVVEKVTGPAGTRLSYPTVEGRVIHPETAANLTRMLVAAVDAGQGDARLARVPGYSVAGKAGGAPVPPSIDGRADQQTGSFVGYAPADAPRFVVLVRIDRASVVGSGETAAAMAFRAIARQLLNYYQIPPSRPMRENGT